jgi:hypothetical protein
LIVPRITSASIHSPFDPTTSNGPIVQAPVK